MFLLWFFVDTAQATTYTDSDGDAMTKIAICIPTLGPPSWRLFDSFGAWQVRHCLMHPGINVDIIRPPRELPVDVARNMLAAEALKGDFDWLWFTDQDAAYLPETLDRLLAWNEDIVGAMCMVRGSDEVRPMVYQGRNPEDTAWRIPIDEVYEFFRMHANRRTNEPQLLDPIPRDSLLKVNFTGCHCLLIRRIVLEKMQPPWFKGDPGTEDRYFHLKAALLGFQPYVDMSTIVGHAVGSKLIGVRDFMANYVFELAMATEEANNGE